MAQVRDLEEALQKLTSSRLDDTGGSGREVAGRSCGKPLAV